MTDTSNEFDWNPLNDEDHSIVVRSQPAVAVYLNPHDEVVVRQEGHYGPDEDNFIYITKDNVPKVVKQMLELVGIPVGAEILRLMAERPDIDWKAVNEDFNDVDLDGPKDKTGAQRQRRYRQRKRNGDGRDVTRDGDRDAVTDRDSHAPFALMAAE